MHILATQDYATSGIAKIIKELPCKVRIGASFFPCKAAGLQVLQWELTAMQGMAMSIKQQPLDDWIIPTSTHNLCCSCEVLVCWLVDS
jgi:hypothetical protein